VTVRINRELPVLRALASAPGSMSTAEVAEACFTGPLAVTAPRKKALQMLRRLEAPGKVEVSGKVSQHGHGGPMLTWKITGAGRAWLAREVGR
jgi:predicted ArsR family transcriptional regulator